MSEWHASNPTRRFIRARSAIRISAAIVIVRPDGGVLTHRLHANDWAAVPEALRAAFPVENIGDLGLAVETPDDQSVLSEISCAGEALRALTNAPCSKTWTPSTSPSPCLAVTESRSRVHPPRFRPALPAEYTRNTHHIRGRNHVSPPTDCIIKASTRPTLLARRTPDAFPSTRYPQHHE